MAAQNNKGHVIANESVIARNEAISSKEPKKLIPKLRFKDFEGDWEQKKLGDISSKVAYGMNSAAIPFDGKHKYLRITDIDEDSRKFKGSSLTSPDGLIEDKFKMKLNDIVFARTGASTGKSYLYNPKDGDLYYAGFLIKFNISKANPYFVYSQTFKESYRKWVQVYSMRSGQPGLNAEEYKNLKISLPKDEEQQKIANFLTAVDTKLQQLNTKKETLAQYKKGVMQQLFSQQTRFKPDVIARTQDDAISPNETEFPDWEEKRLGEISEPIKRTTDEIVENIMTISGKNGFMSQKDRFSQVIAAGSLSKYTYLYKDEFAYNRGNSKSFKYGCVYRLNKNEALVPYVYHCFKLNNGVPEFFEQIFKAKFLDKQLRRLISSSARMDGLLNIGAKSFFNVKVIFPKIEEQQKIATYLSAIDLKIEAVQTQLTKTQAFKKGLLQAMFV